MEGFTKREALKFQEKLIKVQQRQLGNILVAMIKFQSSQEEINELINDHMEDLQIEVNTISEQHAHKQSAYYKHIQQLQQSIMDVELLLGENQDKVDGPLDSEKQYYTQQVDRLKDVIDQNYKKIDAKQMQVFKLKQSLGSKVDGFDQAIEYVDEIMKLMELVAKHEEKNGLQFIQMKGRINKNIEELGGSKIRSAKSELPMIKQILMMAIKDNFNDQNTRKSLTDMLMTLRNKLVGELNKAGGEDQGRINALNNEINKLTEETDKLKRNVIEYSNNLNENKGVSDSVRQNQKSLMNSTNRYKSEMTMIKEQQRVENEQYIDRVGLLRNELDVMQEIYEILQDRRMVEYIEQDNVVLL